MRTDEVQLDEAHLAVRKGQLDAQARSAVVGADQANVRGALRAEGHQTPAREPGLGEHPGIVRVRHRGRRFAQPVEHLALGVRDAVDRAAPFQVHRADVGDDAHLRIGPGDEPGDLSQMVHPAFDHRVAVLGRQPQQGERYSDLVVQVPFRLHRAAGGFQDRGDQLLGRGLSRRAGHRDDAEIGEPLAPGVGERAERPARIRGGKERGGRFRRLHLFADPLRRSARNEDRGGAVLGRLCRELACVVLLADQGDEERALLWLARIGEDAFEAEGRRAGEDLRAGAEGSFVESKAGSHRSASKARPASRRSSKLRFCVPTIW